MPKTERSGSRLHRVGEQRRLARMCVRTRNERAGGVDYYPGDAQSGQPRVLPGSTNLLLEGNRFHDVPNDVPGHHWECLSVSSGMNVALRGIRQSHCKTNAIAIGDQGIDTRIAGTWLLEHWFGSCAGGSFGVVAEGE